MKDGTFNFCAKKEVSRGKYPKGGRKMAVNSILDIHVFIARAREDLRAIFRLRYEVYCLETKSLTAANYPRGEEVDRFDAYSLHIIAKNKSGEAIGTMRLIPDGPHGFLMEESFELPDWIDRARTVEHSREIVRKDYRGYGITNILESIAHAWQKRHGFGICIGAADAERMAPILFKKGWRQIGIPRVYHGITAIPVALVLDHHKK